MSGLSAATARVYRLRGKYIEYTNNGEASLLLSLSLSSVYPSRYLEQ